MGAPRQEPAAEGRTPRILVDDVYKSFAGKPVLRGVTVAVGAGEVLVMLGASGGGKSVLLKHMIGLLRPDKGRIWIDGADFSRAQPRVWREVRRRFGMAFQEGALFDSMNVLENIAFPLRRHTHWSEERIRARVRECLALVQLEGAENKETNELSGGMRRRVGFARAIALKPEILLFDEPNTGLDPITAAIINRVMQHLREEMPVTMVIITHDTKSAFQLADRIVMLRDGRIAAAAPPDEFRQLPDPYIQRFLAGEPVEEEIA